MWTRIRAAITQARVDIRPASSVVLVDSSGTVDVAEQTASMVVVDEATLLRQNGIEITT